MLIPEIRAGCVEREADAVDVSSLTSLRWTYGGGGVIHLAGLGGGDRDRVVYLLAVIGRLVRRCSPSTDWAAVFTASNASAQDDGHWRERKVVGVDLSSSIRYAEAFCVWRLPSHAGYRQS